MSYTILTMIGWGLFYWAVFLYIFWVFVERTFFAGSDPEHWDPDSRVDDDARSNAESPRPIDSVPSPTSLRRAA